jgi:hypothetical protein
VAADKRLVRVAIGYGGVPVSIVEKHAEVTISGRVRLAVAALLFIAGRIALAYA